MGNRVDGALTDHAKTLTAALRYGQPLATSGSGAVELEAAGDNARTAS